MSFSIDRERIKLIKVINNNTLVFRPKTIIISDSQINFLWDVLSLTIKYPQVESYLKNLLKLFNINELENIRDGYSILHYMADYPYNVSLNSFEIIINYGVNINIKDKRGRSAIHELVCNAFNNHVTNIFNLFIKHGANLNIMNNNADTILDLSTHYRSKLDEETKNFIMTIIDFGGTTNNPIKDNVIYDFIEYYKCSNTKPAIKNENKML